MDISPHSRVAVSLVILGAVTWTACSGPTHSKPAEPVRQPPVYFKVNPETAGSLTGRILCTGPKPAPKSIKMEADAACERLHKTEVFDESVVINPGGTLANVFVYIKEGLEGKAFEPPAAAVAIDQRGCWFHPRILGIQTGQTLNVTNSDPLSHNIHLLAQLNREWNQSQAPETVPLVRRFQRTEIMIRVKCDIHRWMRAYIGVVDHPYFAVTGKDGSFEIKNIPPGEYMIEAWQEKLGTEQRKVTVAPSGRATATFTFKGEGIL